MSYSFYVPLDAPPTYERALGAVPYELDTAEGLADDIPPGAWEDQHVLAVWEHGVSTRPVELAWENGSFSVRILSCSCPEDYEMALTIVCAVAEHAGAEVESEEGERFAPADREARYGRTWIAQQVRSMVSLLQMPLGPDPDATAMLIGPTRTFHVGPKMRAWLAELDPTERQDALFERMREVFYPDEERYYAASTMAATTKGGREHTLTALAQGVGYVFPPVEYLSVLDEPPILIRRTDLPELLGDDAVTWLDEEHMRIEAVDGPAWEALLERARERSVNLGGDDTRRARGEGGGAPPSGVSPVFWIVGGLIIAALVWFVLR